METETLDKLYLEWSQFTHARTARERRLAEAIQHALFYLGEVPLDSSSGPCIRSVINILRKIVEEP